MIKNVPMSADPNVAIKTEGKEKTVEPGIKMSRAVWLENGEEIVLKDGCKFDAVPYGYGTSLCARIAKIYVEN